MSRVIFWALAFAFLVWVASTGNACTQVLQEHGVLRNFAIEVYDWRGASIPGARVVLSPSIHSNPGPEPLTATTDADGIARFRNVPVGGYSATTESPNGEHVEITVIDSGSFEPVHPNLRLKWPNLEVILVQSASGRLTSGNAQPLRLALLKADSGERLESVATDRNGNFHFAAAGPGLYFIHVTSSSRSSLQGDIAISIEPTARKAKLDLLIGWSTCGLSYADNVKCAPSRPLEVANLCGRVVDLSGAVISDPLIRIIPATDEPMQDSWRKRNLDDGTFAAGGLLPGQYTLQVSRKGFSTLQLPIRVQHGSGTSCVDPLTVTLGVFPSCSKAEVESHR